VVTKLKLGRPSGGVTLTLPKVQFKANKSSQEARKGIYQI